jgi:hypothetical protein
MYIMTNTISSSAQLGTRNQQRLDDRGITDHIDENGEGANNSPKPLNPHPAPLAPSPIRAPLEQQQGPSSR